MGFWESPDGKIKKIVVEKGIEGFKPYENGVCKIRISNCSLDVEKFNNSEVVIGDSDFDFGRLLDRCLMTMRAGEQCKVVFKLENDVSFDLHLIEFESRGFVYEWTAKTKYDLALHHKTRGVEFFKQSEYVESSRRFGKALRILCSIPIGVEDAPAEIDGVRVADIDGLRCNLYGNLASCYLKVRDAGMTIDLCDKVLAFDGGNVKALYRKGMGYVEEGEFEKARDVLVRVLEIEPGNGAAKERLAFVNGKVREREARVDAMIKKMFVT